MCALLTIAVSRLAFATPMKIMIDPGHGGIDTGAVSGSIHESEVALKIALLLKSKLQKNPDFEVILTRETDTQISLEDRVKKAERQKPDLFLSIHANASPDSRAHGAEFYFQNQLPADEESLFLAAHENKVSGLSAESEPEFAAANENDVGAILDDLKRQQQFQNSFKATQSLAQTWKGTERSLSKAIRQAPFYVISKNSSPSVLVEVGFLSHPTEGPRLALHTQQAELADSIYRSLVKYQSESSEFSTISTKPQGSAKEKP